MRAESTQPQLTRNHTGRKLLGDFVLGGSIDPDNPLWSDCWVVFVDCPPLSRQSRHGTILDKATIGAILVALYRIFFVLSISMYEGCVLLVLLCVRVLVL